MLSMLYKCYDALTIALQAENNFISLSFKKKRSETNLTKISINRVKKSYSFYRR